RNRRCEWAHDETPRRCSASEGGFRPQGYALAALMGCTSRHSVRVLAVSHRVYACCMPSQSSGVVSSARERRRAMSGVMDARPLTMAESALREMPRRRASSVMVMPSGSMCILNRIPPGCVGFLVRVRMAVLLVVVLIVHDM